MATSDAVWRLPCHVYTRLAFLEGVLIMGSKLWIRTYTRKDFHFDHPSADAVCIEDIAHALSMQCRFNGHLRRFCSVAEHCVHASHLVSPSIAHIALLHDAAEAYVGDLVSPLKWIPELGQPFDEVEQRVVAAICRHFAISLETWSGAHRRVKIADNACLVAEARALLGVDPVTDWGYPEPATMPKIIRGWIPEVAEEQFLDRARELGLAGKTVRVRALAAWPGHGANCN
jgi:hypothetical protein